MSHEDGEPSGTHVEGGGGYEFLVLVFTSFGLELEGTKKCTIYNVHQYTWTTAGCMKRLLAAK